ncbi:MAG TPA: FtsX-like permease family protein, partial [Gammaproteobacteria bacterium]|nr:FtsX-like permease family protein [Gammaproteobacteria bacterium]
RVEFYHEVLARVRTITGVERAAVSSQIPMGGWQAPLFVEFQKPPTGPTAHPVMHRFEVSPDYFDTMGVRIIRGRAFGQDDRAGAEPVAIVSETAARRFWKDRDPVGQRVRWDPRRPWMRIVGVAADLRSTLLIEAPQPILYQPLDQSSASSMALLIRTAGATPGLGKSLARAVRAVDPGVPIDSVRTMSDLIQSRVAQPRFLMRLLVAFGAIATGLALLGIYGVMAYSVSQRTRELGVRIAIGATAHDVARMAIGRALGLTVTGVVVGLAVSQALSRLIESQFFGVRAWDPLTLGSVLALMIALAAIAAYFPARRAGRVDPVAALRS